MAVYTGVPETGIVELDRIGDAIGQLGKALRENQTRRETLESRLREADRLAALGTLVAGVAHEVRTPSASMKLKLQLSRAHLAEGGILREPPPPYFTLSK